MRKPELQTYECVHQSPDTWAGWLVGGRPRLVAYEEPGGLEYAPTDDDPIHFSVGPDVIWCLCRIALPRGHCCAHTTRIVGVSTPDKLHVFLEKRVPWPSEFPPTLAPHRSAWLREIAYSRRWSAGNAEDLHGGTNDYDAFLLGAAVASPRVLQWKNESPLYRSTKHKPSREVHIREEVLRCQYYWQWSKGPCRATGRSDVVFDGRHVVRVQLRTSAAAARAMRAAAWQEQALVRFFESRVAAVARQHDRDAQVHVGVVAA